MNHFIVDLTQVGKISVNNVLNDLLLHDTKITVYEENKTYDTGNMIVAFNTSLNRYDIMEAIEDGVTGPFDILKWQSKAPLFQEDGSIDLGTF